MTNPDYTHITFILDNSGSMLSLRPKTLEGFNSFIAKQKALPGRLTFSLIQFADDGLSNIFAGAPVQNDPFGQPLTLNAIPLTFITAPTILPSAPITGPVYDTVNVVPMCGGVGGRGLVGSASWRIPRNIPSNVTVTYEFMDINEVPLLTEANYPCNTMTPLLDAMGYALDKTGDLLAALPEAERPAKVLFVILTDGEENHSRVYSHSDVTAKIKHQTEVYSWEFVYLGANQDAIQVGTSFGIGAGSSMTYATNDASVTSTFNAVSASVGALRTMGVSVNYSDVTRKAVMDGTLES